MPNNNVMMLRAGMNIVWGNQHAEIIHATTDNFLLRFEKDIYECFKPQVLLDAYRTMSLRLAERPANPIIFHKNSPKDIAKLNKLTAYLHELDQRQFPCSLNTRNDVIRCLGPIHGDMSPSNLYRFYTKWVDAGKNVSIFSVKQKKSRRSKFDDAMLDLIEEVIYDLYLTRDESTVRECYEKLKKMHTDREIGGTCISKSYFYEEVDSLDEIEVTLARKGREAARIKSQFTEEKIWAHFPLQYVEVDAVHLNLGILCPETDTFLGTLIIYVAIDRFTRCILGYATSIKGKKGENADSVIECIRHSILPKETLSHCNNQWLSYGLPHYFIFDAGPAFNNIFVASYVTNVGASRIITQVKTPKKKPFIERFFRTLREQFALKIPGYIPKRMSGEIVEESIQDLACVYEHEVCAYLETYICDYYHQNSHRGLDNQTPAEAWIDFYKNSGMSPRLPDNPAIVDAFVGASFNRKLDPNDGVRMNNENYNSPELNKLYYTLNGKGLLADEKIFGIANRNDISKICVVNPETMEMIVVGNTDKRISPGTKFSEQQAKKKAHHVSYPPTFPPEAKERQKSTQKKVGTKPKLSNEPLTSTQSEEDLEGMLAAGTARQAQKVTLEIHDNESTDMVFDFDNVPAAECK